MTLKAPSRARLAIELGLALALLALALSRTSLDDVALAWARCSAPWLAAGFVAFVLLVVTTARRTWVMVDRRVPFAGMVELIVVYVVLANFAAMAVAAAWLVLALRRRHGIEVRDGVATFLLMKLSDLAVLLPPLALTTLGLWDRAAAIRPLLVAVVAGLGLGLVLLVLGLSAPQRALALAAAILRLFPRSLRDRVRRPAAALEAWGHAEVLRLRALARPLLLQSAAILFLTIATWYACARAFGLALDLAPIVLVTSLLTLLAAVPIQVLGGLGVTEASGTWLLAAFGIPAAEGAAFLVLVRVVLYLYVAALIAYLPAAAIARRLGRPAPPTPTPAS